jgi:hypothetical protein
MLRHACGFKLAGVSNARPTSVPLGYSTDELHSDADCAVSYTGTSYTRDSYELCAGNNVQDLLASPDDDSLSSEVATLAASSYRLDHFLTSRFGGDVSVSDIGSISVIARRDRDAFLPRAE